MKKIITIATTSMIFATGLAMAANQPIENQTNGNNAITTQNHQKNTSKVPYANQRKGTYIGVGLFIPLSASAYAGYQFNRHIALEAGGESSMVGVLESVGGEYIATKFILPVSHRSAFYLKTGVLYTQMRPKDSGPLDTIVKKNYLMPTTAIGYSLALSHHFDMHAQVEKIWGSYKTTFDGMPVPNTDAGGNIRLGIDYHF
jgi:hypothetical protein